MSLQHHKEVGREHISHSEQMTQVSLDCRSWVARNLATTKKLRHWLMHFTYLSSTNRTKVTNSTHAYIMQPIKSMQYILYYATGEPF